MKERIKKRKKGKPYFNLFPKVHKLVHAASPDNLNLLKGRPKNENK
jgi:hypothetical protein